MDIPFDVTEWRPTKPPEPGDSERSDSEVTSLIRNLNQQTTDIVQHPYDPNNWILRAETLTRLRYPELALGDAHKASTLCRSHLARVDEHGSGEWRLGQRMGFWMEDAEPLDTTELATLQEILAKLQARAQRLEVKNMYYFPNEEEGRFRRRLYPWTNECHRKRSDKLLALINQEFANNAASALMDEPYCVVKRYAFDENTTGRETSDLLGVFAAHDIKEDEIIVIDRTRTWGCNGPGSGGGYSNLHGGRGCGDPIHPNAESDDISLDLRWVRDEAGRQASSVLLNCRLLLCNIQDGIEHPLDHPLITRLTPTYREDRVHGFSLKTDIQIPNEALHRFGVDIFANQNYDTWVLLTIQARVLNNSCGDPIAESLNPLFCLFNHSCEPNVQWTMTEDHRTIKVRTKRDIKEGEQLLVEYDQFMENQPLEVRRKRMRRWLDGPCQCTRCMREEKEQQKVVAKKDSVADWDIQEKVVFPEDLLKLKN